MRFPIGIPRLVYAPKRSTSRPPPHAIQWSVAPHDLLQEAARPLVVDLPREELEEDVVIYRIKKLLDVELKRPTRAHPILACPTREHPESPHRRMRPLPDPAGIAVENERSVEDWRQQTVDRMVDKSVTDGRLVDHAMLRIENVEPMVRTVPIPPFDKLTMQTEHFVLKVSLECLDIRLPTLSATELPPSRKKILWRYYPRKRMYDIHDAPAFQRTYDLLKHIHIAKKTFEKSEKYTLGERLEETVLTVLCSIADAGHSRLEWKVAAIDRALGALERTKILIRLAWDLEQINERRVAEWQESTQHIGRMLGGWRKRV